MKATVWTNWDANATDYDSGKPKCIFVGEISAVPRVDDYIVVKDGFAAEIVRSVIYNLAADEVEISVRGIDRENGYGPCLRDT